MVRRASSVLDNSPDYIEVVGERKMLANLISIMNNTSHLLHLTVEALSSSFTCKLQSAITAPSCTLHIFKFLPFKKIIYTFFLFIYIFNVSNISLIHFFLLTIVLL